MEWKKVEMSFVSGFSNSNVTKNSSKIQLMNENLSGWSTRNVKQNYVNKVYQIEQKLWNFLRLSLGIICLKNYRYRKTFPITSIYTLEWNNKNENWTAHKVIPVFRLQWCFQVETMKFYKKGEVLSFDTLLGNHANVMMNISKIEKHYEKILPY